MFGTAVGLQQGCQVAAVGSPFGLLSPTHFFNRWWWNKVRKEGRNTLPHFCHVLPHSVTSCQISFTFPQHSTYSHISPYFSTFCHVLPQPIQHIYLRTSPPPHNFLPPPPVLSMTSGVVSNTWPPGGTTPSILVTDMHCLPGGNSTPYPSLSLSISVSEIYTFPSPPFNHYNAPATCHCLPGGICRN